MKKLYRSRSDVMIAGVCSGLADYFGIDSTVVRLVFMILLFAGLGGLWLYIVLWIVMPLQPSGQIESVEVQSDKESKDEAKDLPKLPESESDDKA